TGFEITNGLRKAGLVVTGINYRLRGPEVAYVLNDSGARVVVAGPDHVDVVETAQSEVIGEVRYIAVGDRVPVGWLGFEELMRAAQERLPRNVSSLRALIIGAAPFPYALKQRAESVIGQILWEFYGATETGINTVLRPEEQLRKPGSCGTAVPGQEIRLVDAEG